MQKNFNAARAILNGETVVSRDRRKGDAPKVEFTTRKVREGRRTLQAVQTAYGVSYAMHEALEKLSTRTDCVNGRFVYLF